MNKRLTELVNLLEESRTAVLSTVEGLSQDALDRKPDAENWSIGEILGHLWVTETGITRILNKQISRAQQKGIGPETNDESVAHSLDQFNFTVATTKVKAPNGFVPAQGTPKEELLKNLNTSRATFLETIKKGADFDLTQLEFPHPMMGKLNMYQWILFVDQHERRHHGQMMN